ncbi:MAG: hypothetical protein M3Y56_06470 [Armatimonadota bacterium]|nr:hypothetical protein [Armatimonadota bacterium]
MKKSSKLVGLVLLSSTAFLSGCGGGNRTGDAQGMYTGSDGNQYYSNGTRYYGSRSNSWFGGSHSSSSERGGFGSMGHSFGSHGGGGE